MQSGTPSEETCQRVEKWIKKDVWDKRRENEHLCAHSERMRRSEKGVASRGFVIRPRLAGRGPGSGSGQRITIEG